MAQTITLKVEDHVHAALKQAAKKEGRTLPVFIKNTLLNYLHNNNEINDNKMKETPVAKKEVKKSSSAIRSRWYSSSSIDEI
ncbi:MAG: hypothetical protein FWH12_01310 [Treponema sp.]|nr:hypothetical protein [Treponema sp.]